MNFASEIVKKSEIDALNRKIEDKIRHVSSFSQKKLQFEKQRCEQILNRNIPMCVSMHTKNIIQSNNQERILGQLHRLNIECYWKVLNLVYLEKINKCLSKTNG
jgi:ribosomal protein L39E